MKSMTIHDLDPLVNEAIEQIARKREWSKHKTVKYLLKKAVEELLPYDTDRDFFTQFLGMWTEEETKEFEKVMGDFDQIDETLWL